MSDKMYDVRLVRHHIRRQVLDSKALDAHLDDLEDVAEMGEPTETRFVGYTAAREDEEREAAE